MIWIEKRTWRFVQIECEEEEEILSEWCGDAILKNEKW